MARKITQRQFQALNLYSSGLNMYEVGDEMGIKREVVIYLFKAGLRNLLANLKEEDIQIRKNVRKQG